MEENKIALIRTATPIIVGILMTTAIGPWLDPDAAKEVVSGLIAIVWYAVFKYIEGRGVRKAGWMLGYPGGPSYNVAPENDADGEDGDDF